MKTIPFQTALLIFFAMLSPLASTAYAADSKTTLVAAPLSYSFVGGDSDPEKFKEQNWTDRGYTGGIEDFTFEGTNLPGDVMVETSGRAIPGNNDYAGDVMIRKPDLGFFHFNYEEFRKYFDNTGGVYYPFSRLNVNNLDRELALDIGHITVETGLTVENWPALTFVYDRHFKNGTKSRLTWTPVRDGGVTRNIGPSWQQVDEIVDSITLKETYTIKGYELKADQHWEWMRAEMSREEQSLSTVASATDANNKIRVQEQNPETNIFSTTLGVEKWSKEDRIFTGTAFHYLKLRNNELENIIEMNSSRRVFNNANPKQVRNARADNTYDSSTWVGNAMFLPWDWLSLNPKLRVEGNTSSGDSLYPQDTTVGTPDGIINNTELSQTEDKVARIGEGFNINFTAIPRTALYNEFELEQVRNYLSEDRNSLAGQSAPNANETFSRETLTHIYRGVWTIGGRVSPWYWVDWTSNLRLSRSNNDYDDKRETDSTGTTARSAFFDAVNIHTNELATRVTFKPVRWFRPSARYQYQLRGYFSRFENQAAPIETHMDSHIFTFDLAVQPIDKLLIITALSPQYTSVVTPARNVDISNIPRFEGNILTWMLHMNYNVTERIGLNSGLEYSKSSNFNDFTSSGLPLASDYNLTEVSAGIEFAVTKNVSVETNYGLYHYGTNNLVDSGDYTANVVSMRTKFNWG